MPSLDKTAKRWWIPERKTQARRKQSNQKLYNSKEWRMTSKRNLANNPLCVLCERKGLVVAAEVTDHIVPINQGGLVYGERNHQSLCIPCHNKKSGREAHNKKQD